MKVTSKGNVSVALSPGKNAWYLSDSRRGEFQMLSQEEEQIPAKNIARVLGLSTRGLVTMPKYNLELSET
jgi:hypothetical protein